MLRARLVAADSRHPRRRGVTRGSELEAADGNRFAAFGATPEEPSDVGVVILPDVRGLYRFYEELALRFAERGMAAVAFDFFGRTAGAAKRGDDFDYRPHVEQTTPEGVQADVAAASRSSASTARTRSSPSASASAGGTRGSPQPTRTVSPGAVGFYGRPADATARAGELKAPILALQAGDDQNITAEDNAAFDAGAERRRRRARARHVRRRAAQLLRPQAGGVRRGVGRRMVEDACASSRRTLSDLFRRLATVVAVDDV